MPDHDDERRYQVFVSSTFKDLQEERQKVLQAILETTSFPAGMELFPAADDEQWEFIKREIDSSDYYIVIVAGKYGSLAADGLSFTEKEYDYAVEAGKPVMGFVCKDLSELKGSKLEEDGDRRAKLSAFRAKVGRGKLIKFYQNPDELKTQVWQALTRSFKLSPRDGWVRAKQARRLEDLEEINRLQKRVMELEAETNRLKQLTTDRRSSLEQGADDFRYELILGRLGEKEEYAPPTGAFQLHTTWNDVFLACVGANFPVATEDEITFNFVEFTRQIVLKALEGKFEGSRSWFEIAANDHPVDPSSLMKCLMAVKRQLLGLGYIEIDRKPSGESWILTSEGKLQLSLLSGAIRSPLPD